MNFAATPTLQRAPKRWAQALVKLGFSPAGGVWRRKEMLARIEPDWLILETAHLSCKARQSNPAPGHRGLWKRVACKHDQMLAFEIPAALIADGAEPDETMDAGEDLAGALVEWALASANGNIPRGWQPPGAELISAWLPPGALTVQAGGLVRQGESLLGPDRWALRFPILPSVPAELPPDRRRALDLLAADAQSQCRMIRVGWMEHPDGVALTAAVDFTGAPHAEYLFLTGLEGLTQAVARLVETANLLADATVTLRALEVCRV
ncbi:MAG TPA: hypothetical protein P5205_11675 [Candidatus Paceibacterota bacterium]|nr:hypothetical protein [Verrucomicrobiota bacterium]HSA11018.1 hypothetical protein [Candidatus Paceibacterota bacterium]